ncbi:MAG: helix-turn-helix domain-containing protein [Bacteroidota bacterium]
MQPQIILSGITFDELQDSFKSIVKTEVERIISNLPTTPEPNPEYITRKETAEILGISLVTLNDWTKNGTIPAQRIGTRIRYKRTDIYNSLKEVETLKYRRF